MFSSAIAANMPESRRARTSTKGVKRIFIDDSAGVDGTLECIMHFKVSHDAVERGMPQCAESTHCAAHLHIARLDIALSARMQRIATAKKTAFCPRLALTLVRTVAHTHTISSERTRAAQIAQVALSQCH